MHGTKFGEHLLIARETAGVRRSVLARELEVSQVYLRDVELGHQRPLRADRINRAAHILAPNVPDGDALAETLHRLALEDREEFTLPVNPADVLGQLRIASLLQREWPKLKSTTMRKIICALEANPHAKDDD